MFFPFIGATGVALGIGLGFVQLGALSVWVTVLSLALKLTVTLLVLLSAYMAWDRIRRT
jgi:hypothetical protein